MASFNAQHLPGWLQTIVTYISRGQPLYLILYALLIIFFAFFYTSVVFNPEETAENLKKYGGVFPGIRPGKKSAQFIDYTLTRITVIGALYLAFVCLIPEFLFYQIQSVLLAGRHLDPDRGLGHHGHGGADPKPSDRAAI